MQDMEVGYASEEFTSAFETRENTAKYNDISRVSTAAGGDTPPEYTGNSSSSALQVFQQTPHPSRVPFFLM